MATGTVIPPGTYDEEEGEVLESGGTLSKLEEADRRSQVAIAKQYPRSITLFRQRLSEIARANQAVAMEMMYSLPRAGKQLVGPSVRFAEAVLSCWGNNRAGVEVVDINAEENYVVAEGRFYDCEQNSGIAVRVRRRNVMKKDADGFQVTGQAASSIALRNAILRGVPKALWADIFEEAKQTAAGKAESIAMVREEKVKLFTALGIPAAKLYAKLGVSGKADIGTDEIVAMAAWHKQLINKDSTIEDIFGYPEDEEIETLMNLLEWPQQQRALHRKAFEKNKQGSLDYLRAEAAKIGHTPAAATKPAAAKSAPAEPAAEVDTTTTSNTETEAASTSQESKPAPAPAAVKTQLTQQQRKATAKQVEW